MPQAVAFAAAYAASNAAAAVGATVGAQAVIASAAAAIGPALIIGGATLALSALLRPGAPETPRPSDGQSEEQQPIPPGRFPYGRVKTSGPLAFFEDTTNDSDVVGKIVLLSFWRNIDAIEEHYLDGRRVITGDDSYVINAYLDEDLPYAKLQRRLGADPQDAVSILTATFPDIWTTDHRLNGCAYTALWFQDVTADQQMETYPNHIPTYMAKVRGAKMWDPRDPGQILATKTTHLWSDNPTLCVLDWLLYDDGFNLPLADIDVPSFMAKANIDDQLVPLKGGGSERRYRVSTTAFLNEPKKDVLTRLRNACAGQLYPTSDGKIGIRGGVWTEPTVSLSSDFPEAGIIEATFTNGPPELSRYNELSVKCLSPDHDYVEVEVEPWVNQSDIDAHGVITQALDLPQVPSHNQARRLAKIIMARDNAIWAGPIRTKFQGVSLFGEEAVTLASAELNGGPDDFNGPFWIDGDVTLEENGTVSMGTRRADPDSFEWNEATEEADLPRIPPDEKIPFTEGVAPDPVTGVSAFGSSQSATIEWTLPADPEFAAARVWRSKTTSFDDAIDVSGPITVPLDGDVSAVTEMSFVDSVTSGTYEYFVTAENTIGNRGAPVGPDAVVVGIHDFLGIGGGNILGAGNSNELGIT